MAEVIRSVEIVLTVDTNKRTITRTIEVDALSEAPERLREEIGDLLG